MLQADRIAQPSSRLNPISLINFYFSLTFFFQKHRTRKSVR